MSVRSWTNEPLNSLCFALQYITSQLFDVFHKKLQQLLQVDAVLQFVVQIHFPVKEKFVEHDLSHDLHPICFAYSSPQLEN